MNSRVRPKDDVVRVIAKNRERIAALGARRIGSVAQGQHRAGERHRPARRCRLVSEGGGGEAAYCGGQQ